MNKINLLWILALFLLIPITYAAGEIYQEDLLVLWQADVNLTHSNDSNNLNAFLIGVPVINRTDAQVGSGSGTWSGNNDGINFSNSIFTSQINFTVGGWLKSTGSGGIMRIAARNGFDAANNWVFWYDDRGGQQELKFDSAGVFNVIFANTYTVSNTWNHVALVFSITGTTQLATLYVNGSVVDTSGASGAWTPGINDFTLGKAAHEAANTNAWDDNMDEWWLYNGTMTQAQIQYIYNLGDAGTPITPTPSPDITPPEITLINLTPEGGLGYIIFNQSDEQLGKLSGVAKTNDTTPTFFIKTNENSNCAIVDNNTNINYTDITYGSSECESTGTTIHTCTLPSANKTGRGFHNFSVGCKDSNNNENLTSTAFFTVNITDPGPDNVTLLLDGLSVRIYEYRTKVNISATCNSGDGGDCQVEIDLNAPDYGDNYSYGIDSYTSFIYNITTLRQSNFTQTIAGNDSFCYQETATEATYCGGLSTGGYAFGGGEAWTNEENIYDEDWDTWGLATDGGATHSVLLINYTIPTRALNSSLWQVKDYGGRFNLSIPSDCFNTPIQFKINGSWGYSVNWSCYTGSYWYELRNISGGNTNYMKVYEEAMWWNLSTSIYYQVNVPMDSKTQMVAAQMNISSAGTTSDLNITYGPRTIYLRGDIKGEHLEYDKFIEDSVYKDAVNLTYLSAGSNFIFVNLTDVDNPINLTFEISGFDLDIDNEFSYTEHFNKSAIINQSLSFHTDAPLGYFDDFTANNSIWSLTDVGSYGCSETFQYVDDSLQYTGSVSSRCTGLSCNKFIDYSDNAADFRNTTIIENNLYYSITKTQSGPTDSDVEFILQATDGTNRVDLLSEPDNIVAVVNYTLIRVSDDYETWELFRNGTSKGNKDLGSLDFTKQIKLSYKFSGGAGGLCEHGSASATIVIRLLDLKWGGAWLNRSINNGTYKSNGNFTSGVVKNTTNNISRATLSCIDYVPTGTNIDYYLSSTCTNTTPKFESVQLGILHTFDSHGNQICWRAVLNSNINITSPIVRKCTIEVVKATAENVTVDINDDGTIDFTFTGTLNESTSPTFVNLTPTANRLNTLKISSSSAGMIQVNNFKVNSSINPIILNETEFENCDSCTIDFIYSGDEAIIENVQFDFLGSWNYTATARYKDLTDTRTIQIYYSDFNVSLPTGLEYYDVFATSQNQTNITPYGQDDNTPIWNVTKLAYEKNIDVYVKTNETMNVCLNITYTNNSLRSINIVNESFTWINGTPIFLENQNILNNSEVVFNQTSGEIIGSNNYTMDYADGSITLNSSIAKNTTRTNQSINIDMFVIGTNSTVLEFVSLGSESVKAFDFSFSIKNEILTWAQNNSAMEINFGNITINSETLYNNGTQVNKGKNYTMNYTNGSITFTNASVLWAGQPIVNETLTWRQNNSAMELAHINLITDSETLYNNGTKINKGSNYTMNYTNGSITFTNASVLWAGQPIIRNESLTWAGNNSAMNLVHINLVVNSEILYNNGTKINKGANYTMEYTTGSITFTNSSTYWNGTNELITDKLNLSYRYRTDELLTSKLNLSYRYRTDELLTSKLNLSYTYVKSSVLLNPTVDYRMDYTIGNLTLINESFNNTQLFVTYNYTVYSIFAEVQLGINYSYLVYGFDYNQDYTFILNTSYQKIIANISESKGIWNWWNLYSCGNRFEIPWVYFASICSSCYFDETQLDNYNIIET